MDLQKKDQLVVVVAVAFVAATVDGIDGVVHETPSNPSVECEKNIDKE